MGYRFVNGQDAFDQFRAEGVVNGGAPTVINRVDVDFSLGAGWASGGNL